MCPISRKLVGLSLERLKIHHTSTHGIRTESQKCKPCKMKFTDAMAKNVHMLKHHAPQFKCTKCDLKCNDTTQLNAHIHENHTKKTEETKIKCIVCDFASQSEPDLTKHYEEKHITSSKSSSVSSNKPNRKIRCKNGPSCRYLKEDRCTFLHDKPSEQPWQKLQPRKQKPQQNVHSGRQTQQGAQPKSVCRNGPSCMFLKYNKCNYDHSESRHQYRPTHKQHPEVSGQVQGGMSSRLRPCKFGHKCDKGVDCGFLHLPSDFLPNVGRRRN